MGAFNFYIKLKVNINSLAILDHEYKVNNLYHCAFYYGKTPESENVEYNVGISSVIDNFLPANQLIYKFISALGITCQSIYMETRGVERTFDFERQSDFICFMYSIWEPKIIATYGQFGVILIDNNNYYKIRNKLYKKYYKIIGLKN